jgi:uncharacterized membrane protein (DUF2068 family)
MQLIKGVRVVAVFEAAKGLIVLLVGFGLLSHVHDDVQQVAAALVGHFHLNPASRYPHVFLQLATHFSDVRIWLLAGLAFAYTAVRWAEAYGLWFGRRWAEWFAVASGGFYIPMEIYELLRGFSWTKAGTLFLNIAIVAYIAYALWRTRRAAKRQQLEL